MANKRVLIVEDEPDLAQTMCYALEREGIECLAVEDGAKAVELARQARPDLILLDIMLPKMTGYGVAKLLKLDHACRDIPIVMVTALGEEKYARYAEEAGADRYITKPFHLDVLIGVVKECLEAAVPVVKEVTSG